MEQRSDLFDQPHEFGRQSKRRRLSLLCDKGQACAPECRCDRTMLSLGVRISFVQKISVSSTFRSIRAEFLGKEFNPTPAMCRAMSGKRSRNHTKEAVWLSQQSGRPRLRPGAVGILHRDENPERTDRQRVHHFRPRNTRRDSRHRA